MERVDTPCRPPRTERVVEFVYGGGRAHDADERVGFGDVDEDGVDTGDGDEGSLGSEGDERKGCGTTRRQLFVRLITHQAMPIYGIAPAFPDHRRGARPVPSFDLLVL